MIHRNADHQFIIEEIIGLSGYSRQYKGTVKQFVKQFELEGGAGPFVYKNRYEYICEPRTAGELVRALNKLAKFGTQWEGIRFCLLKA